MDKLILKTLTLQNFTTFENQTIHFSSNFNAIVGETGSGKSLILDALELILGSRGDRKIIRKNAEFASIEAHFEAKGEKICTYLNDLGFPFENDTIIIKRIIPQNGSFKSFLNFGACPLTTLATFSKKFVDIIGQFENQKLLSEDYQLGLLDSFCNHNELLIEYKETYQKLKTLENKLHDFHEKKEKFLSRMDYLDYQIKEIEKLSPNIQDEKDLISKKSSILESEQREQAFSLALYLIAEGESSISGNLKKLINLSTHEKTAHFFSEELKAKLQEASLNVEECSYMISKTSSAKELNEEDLESILDRLDAYQKLKKKFGGSIETVLASLEAFREEFREFKNIDDSIEYLAKEIETTKKYILTLAETLNKNRSKNAKIVSDDLTKATRELRMLGATIELKVLKTDSIGPKGIDQISFLAETNPGQGLFKIKDIASGGELSRILLALRQILAGQDSISIFLFDEIDTGVGGETALKIGKALQNVSKKSQVIAITHLPQIAFHSDQIVHVSKNILDKGQKTVSKIDLITNSKEKTSFIQTMTPLQ